MMNTMTSETTVAIAVPLEAELVDRLRAVDPSVTVLYEPDLLPPERFPADHSGDPDFKRTPAQEEKYWAMLNQRRCCTACPTKAPPAWPASRARIHGSSGSTPWPRAPAVPSRPPGWTRKPSANSR